MSASTNRSTSPYTVTPVWNPYPPLYIEQVEKRKCRYQHIYKIVSFDSFLFGYWAWTRMAVQAPLSKSFHHLSSSRYHHPDGPQIVVDILDAVVIEETRATMLKLTGHLQSWLCRQPLWQRQQSKRSTNVFSSRVNSEVHGWWKSKAQQNPHHTPIEPGGYRSSNSKQKVNVQALYSSRSSIQKSEVGRSLYVGFICSILRFHTVLCSVRSFPRINNKSYQVLEYVVLLVLFDKITFSFKLIVQTIYKQKQSMYID